VASLLTLVGLYVLTTYLRRLLGGSLEEIFETQPKG
jgi:hypothetical protein